jgi:hypothetical protein
MGFSVQNHKFYDENQCFELCPTPGNLALTESGAEKPELG